MKLEHFKISEFKCKCGCDENRMDKAFLHMIDSARDRAGVGFRINSGYRCPDHEKAIGGKGNHSKGIAADIKTANLRIRFIILSALIDAGFNRIGIAKTFIHIDTSETKSQQVIWLY